MLTVSGYLPTSAPCSDERIGRSDASSDSRAACGGPLPVGELARQFPVSRPAISQHLRILKRAHLVVDTPVGNRRLYAVDPEGIDRLRAYFDRFWTQALDAFKTMAEQTAKKEER
jgi:DNA-binding transcriptional ArsR family regulator